MDAKDPLTKKVYQTSSLPLVSLMCQSEIARETVDT